MSSSNIDIVQDNNINDSSTVSPPQQVEITANMVVHYNDDVVDDDTSSSSSLSFLDFLKLVTTVYVSSEKSIPSIESSQFSNVVVKTERNTSAVHTFLKFIVDKYESKTLPDIIIFYEYSNNTNNITFDSEFWKNTVLQTLNIGYSISALTLETNPQILTDKSYFVDWFENSLSHIFPVPFVYYQQNAFAVRVDYILRRPLSFYKMLLELTDEDNNTFISKSWFYIFMMNYVFDQRLRLDTQQQPTQSQEQNTNTTDKEKFEDITVLDDLDINVSDT